MARTLSSTVLTEAVGPSEGTARILKQVALVFAGIAAMAVLAKIKVPLWPLPVPITLQTFGVLLIGTAYGARLGLATMVGYLLVGALGFDVFTSSTAENSGLGYMLGGTGGYLLGFAVAALILGAVARRGWDRHVAGSLAGMVAATAVIYAMGMGWLGYLIQRNGWFDAAAFGSVWEQTLAWGLAPFVVGEAIKLALAALLVPALWKLVGAARS